MPFQSIMRRRRGTRVPGVPDTMNVKEQVLVETVMDMISGTLDTMKADEFHAPAPWLLENWWCTLNAALQVGDHLDNKSHSFKTTDEAESKKRDEDVQPDEPFKV